MFFFLHLVLPNANWAQPGVLFVLPEVFTLVLGPSFDLPCLLATAILDFFSLFYLPNIPPVKRWEAQFFGNRGIKVFLATSC